MEDGKTPAHHAPCSMLHPRLLTLVVARYNEDVSWVNLIPANVVIVNKSQIGNTGREASSWLWYIAHHELRGDYVFCQGDPYAHCPNFDSVVGKQRHYGPRVKCDLHGAPHHPGLKIEGLLAAINLVSGRKVQLPAELEFTAGAQFQASAEEIQRGIGRGWNVQNLMDIANTHPQAPWVFERLWDYLIPTNNHQPSTINQQ